MTLKLHIILSGIYYNSSGPRPHSPIKVTLKNCIYYKSYVYCSYKKSGRLVIEENQSDYSLIDFKGMYKHLQ